MKRRNVKYADERSVQACIDQLQAIIEGRRPGTEFTLSPRRLGLSREAFHALAERWEANRGGDGFTLVYVHRSAHTRLIDLVTVRRFSAPG